MRSRIIKITLATILIVCLFTGCGLGQKNFENGYEKNEAFTSYATNQSNSDNDDNVYAEQSNDFKKTEPNNFDIAESVTTKTDSNTFTVIFKDSDGNILKSEKIKKGDDAIPPDEPTKYGYKFIGWNYDYKDVQTDIITTAIFEEITKPTLVVDDVTVKAGDKVDVTVSVLNNPGVLGMLVDIQYDDTVLSLTGVTNGTLTSKYMFTPPKNMKSGCNAAWNINDIPEGKQDGDIMTLHFKVLKKAKIGEYIISVSCFNNAFNDSYESFSFESIDGSIKVN